MINIRPVSDLRNKFPEIENTVLNTGEPVYLTKNGYGSMVEMCIRDSSQCWANGDLTGEQMKEALLASHYRLAAQEHSAHETMFRQEQ